MSETNQSVVEIDREVYVAYSKRCLALAVVISATFGNSTRAASSSSSSSNRYWWAYAQSHANWSARPWAASQNYLPVPSSALSTPAAPSDYPSTVAPQPVRNTPSTQSSASFSAPLFAVPYQSNNSQNTVSQPAAPIVAPVTSVYNAPVSAPLTTTPAPSTPPVNGFINMGTGPFPSDSAITTGGTQPWYNSPYLNNFFGGHPTPEQQANFSNAVLQDVQHSFALSGVNVTLTNNPNVPADHTLSVVSNTSAALLPSAIGMTQVGGSGFSFMDQEAKSAQTLQQLEQIVAHNVSHELMLAFGVGENYDHTGNYIDAPNASFAMMTNPSATFSTEAANALNQALQQGKSLDNSSGQFAQEIDPKPVPEPATIAIWTCGALLGMVFHRKRLNAKNATKCSI